MHVVPVEQLHPELHGPARPPQPRQLSRAAARVAGLADAPERVPAEQGQQSPLRPSPHARADTFSPGCGGSGLLGDTDMALDDRAAHICPVGVILPKRRGFAVPIGARRFDVASVAELDHPEAS